MYSNLYLYYEIRKDKNYSEALPIIDIAKVFEETGVLKKKSSVTFENTAFFPWLSLSIVMTKDGNYSVDEHAKSKNANLIVVVCNRGNDEKQYLDLLFKIAKQLQWELTEEDAD